MLYWIFIHNCNSNQIKDNVIALTNFIKINFNIILRSVSNKFCGQIVIFCLGTEEMHLVYDILLYSGDNNAVFKLF